MTPDNPAVNAHAGDAASPIAVVPTQPRTDDNSENLAMLFCPICDIRLVSLRCKLLCERCGYYMSCADYY
jgi:hypothetical protein